MTKYKSLRHGHLGRVSVAKHSNVLGPADALFIHLAPNCLGPKLRELERENSEKIRGAGVAERPEVEWVSSVALAPRKVGSLQFCFDNRRVNAFTKRDSYLIPRTDEFIDSLEKTKMFSALHVSSGYCRIEMENKDFDKTALSHIVGFLSTRRCRLG